MRKIAVFLTKGGVGKTTTAVNTAAGLARSGARVLLIDTDTQGHVSAALGASPVAGLAQVLTGELPIPETIIEVRERLWLLAGGGALAGAKRVIARKDFGGEHTLKEILLPLEDAYDYVIVDTAPGWDPLNVNVLFYVDEILAPVSLEVLTLASLREFATSIAGVQRYHPALSIKYIVPTFLDGRVKKSQEILEQLQAYYGPQVCAPIHYSVRLSEAPGHGQTIYEYAPTSTGAADYQQLTERLAHG
jgi:chromosome partitioning protein